MSEEKRLKEIEKDIKKINKQLDTIAENIAFNQILLSNIAQNFPPPLSCPSGFSCRRITLEGIIGIETGVKPSTNEIFVGLIIAGVSLGGVVLSLSNPRAVLGGEIYIAKAELVLEFAIENNLPVLYLSGEACIGPDFLDLRTCTRLSRTRIGF